MESLVALNCSIFSSTLLSSTLGSLNPFSEGGLELCSTLLSSALGSLNPFSEGGLEKDTLPDTELTLNGESGKLLGVVDWDIFGRGLDEAPRTLEACVRRLYVLRMMSRMVRIIMMPMTMTAIMAPELWTRICSLDLVTVVVFAVVVLIAGETVEVCMFGNSQVSEAGPGQWLCSLSVSLRGA